MLYNAFIVCVQMSDGTTEQLKRFVFSSKINSVGEQVEEKLEIVIPEVENLIQINFALCSIQIFF